MRSDDIWLVTGYDDFKGKFYCWDKMETHQAIINFVEGVLSEYEDE